MTGTEDALTRMMREITEKKDAETAERERIAAERIVRLRASGMTDEQIRVAFELMQEILDEQQELIKQEWNKQAKKVAAATKRAGARNPMWAVDPAKSRRPRKRRGQPNSQGIA